MVNLFQLSIILSTAIAVYGQSEPQLALAVCNPSSTTQSWYYNTTNSTLVLNSNGYCMDVLAYGTTPGSEIYTNPCHHDDKDPAHQNQEFTAPNTTDPIHGGYIIEIMSGLAIDSSGSLLPGAYLTLQPASPTSSLFYLNTSNGQLIHTVSGLCVDAAGSSSSPPKPMLLNECNANNNWRQAFVMTAQNTVTLVMPNAYNETLCITAATGGVGGNVVSYQCPSSSTSVPSSQIFMFDTTTGHLISATGNNGLVVDAGFNVTTPLSDPSTYYIGMPLNLNTNTSSAYSSVFEFVPLSPLPPGYPANAGTFVHKVSGLCLDGGPIPNGHGCLDPQIRLLPFCNASLSVDERVADLLQRMTLAEKIGLTGSGNWNDGRSSCDTIDPGVLRLSIPPTEWLVETNSMIASQCYAGATCATSFPSALNLAASFNRTVWAEKGRVMSDEMRALNNLAWHRADTTSNTLIGLNGFGPDINQPRDPRNGRIGELPSEDPYLIGEYATYYVQAVQGFTDTNLPNPPYYKTTAGLKHYTGYSLETGRFSSRGNFSIYDLFDTYLKPYEKAFVEGQAAGTMCSYISLGIPDGPPYVPSCANEWLLTTLVREYWGQPGAIHTSDCGAVQNMAPNHYTANDTESAAVSLNAGLNLNSNTILPNNLGMAISLGLTNESVLDWSVGKTLAMRIRSGMLDPIELNPWKDYGLEHIGTPDNLAAAMEGVAQGTVLIKNDNGALPLKTGQNIAVLGPLAAAQYALMGDYYADAVCPGSTGWDKGSYACIPKISDSISNLNTGGTTVTFPGVSISGNDSSWGDAITAASTADAIVLVLGTDQTIAGEGTDRTNIGLPGLQADFAAAVVAAKKSANVKVTFILISSFPVSFDPLVNIVDGIVLGYAPCFGAPAIANALFGANRWGRATISIYPQIYQNAVSIFDFSMVPTDNNPGRSYRYYNGSTGNLLVRFGQGLTYSTINVNCMNATIDNMNEMVNVSCSINNLPNSPAGDQILQVYHRVSSDVMNIVNNTHPVPLSTLVAFDRVTVGTNQQVGINFSLSFLEGFTLIDSTGATVLYPGLHYLDIWDGSSNNITLSVEIATEETGVRVMKRPPLPQY